MNIDAKVEINKAVKRLGEKLNIASCTYAGGFKSAEIGLFADTIEECVAVAMTLNSGKKAVQYRDIITNMMANVAQAVNGEDLEMAKIAFETAQEELSVMGEQYTGHPTITTTEKGTKKNG